MGIFGLSETNSWVIVGVVFAIILFAPIAIWGIVVMWDATREAASRARYNFKIEGNIANRYHRYKAGAARARNNNNARNKLFEGANDAKKERELARAEKEQEDAANQSRRPGTRNAAELDEAIGLAGRRRKDSRKNSRKQKKN